MEPIIVITNYPNKPRELKKLIIIILKKWLAKCINRINYMKSYYLLEGKIQIDEEKMVMIKTTVEKKEALIAFIKANHPYKTPLIYTLKPQEVNQEYINRLYE